MCNWCSCYCVAPPPTPHNQCPFPLLPPSIRLLLLLLLLSILCILFLHLLLFFIFLILILELAIIFLIIPLSLSFVLSSVSPITLQTTHTSGNHGQALAWSANRMGLSCHVVTPRDTPDCKIQAIQSYGADVILCEPTPTSR